MSNQAAYTINVGGHLLSLDEPLIMGILNVTPDSFYIHHETDEAMTAQVRRMVAEGAAILDIGACSTRPGSTPVDEAGEMERLRHALTLVRREAPEAILSVDTFRASVARMCIGEFGVQIVNDVYCGEADPDMFRTVADLGVPYILTHCTPITATSDAEYMAEFMRTMGAKVEQLHELGVCDVILDPGFGFGKTLEQNYTLLRNMEVLHELEVPMLVGVSHKSMIWKLLGITPAEALNGTTVLHTIALQKGAHILRVHDVREAAECIQIVKATMGCQS